MSTQDRLEINWINTAGGALGAVSSALLLSTLGAAGTLVGAAIGSLCISVGGSVYAHSMRKTKNRVAAVASTTGALKTRARGGKASTPGGEPAPSQAADAPKQDPDKDGLPWKRIAVMAGALFAIAIAVILAFELATGKPVSSYTGGTSDTSGGTTFSRVTDSQGGSDDDSQDGESDEGDQAPDDDEQQDEEQQDDELQDDEQQDEEQQNDEQQDEEQQNEEQQDEEPAPEEQEQAPEPEQEEAPAPVEEPQGAPGSDE